MPKRFGRRRRRSQASSISARHSEKVLTCYEPGSVRQLEASSSRIYKSTNSRKLLAIHRGLRFFDPLSYKPGEPATEFQLRMALTPSQSPLRVGADSKQMSEDTA